MNNAEQPLLVTTSYRGVFFGYGVPTEDPVIHLKRCRMVVYWPQEVHGVVGLAQVGPLKGSRVTPAADEMTLQGVTSVATCTPKAAKQWESEPWS